MGPSRWRRPASPKWQPTPWTWLTPSGPATLSSPVSCRGGCEGGGPGGGWAWRRPGGRWGAWRAGECLDTANACGACAVTVPGDLKGLPTEEEALALLRGLGSQDA